MSIPGDLKYTTDHEWIRIELLGLPCEVPRGPEMSERWYAATVQKSRNQPYGPMHAVEVRSRTAVCGVEAFPRNYCYGQLLDGRRVFPNGLCRRCALTLIAAAAKTHVRQV